MYRKLTILYKSEVKIKQSSKIFENKVFVFTFC